MGTISGLYQRFRHLIHEGAKFLVIGALGTVVTFAVANGLHSVGKYKAITIATIVATIVTYLGNRYWTFRHRQSQGTTRDSIVFFVLNGIGLIIYWGCIGLTDLAGLGNSKIWYNIALVVGTGLGTLFRFWSYRKWVWTAPQTPVASPAEPDDELAQDIAALIGAAPAHNEPAGPGRHQRTSRPDPGAAQAGQAPAKPVRVPASHRRTR